jgi:hypothetical protein
MLYIGVPIVLCWVGFACLVIWSGLQNDKVINNIDGYATLLAIIGGPALLIVTSMLELWKNEQSQEISLVPEETTMRLQILDKQAEGDRAASVAAQKHAEMLEKRAQGYELSLMQSVFDEEEQ